MTSIVGGQGTPGGGFDTVPQSKPTKQFLGFNPAMPQTGGFRPMTQPMQQQFGPGSNLIGTQFNPVASQRGQGAAGMTDKAAGSVSNYQFQGFNPMTANTSQSQGIYDNLLKTMGSGGGPRPVSGMGTQLSGSLQPLLDKVTNAPDRGQLAQDMYGVLEERANPGFQQRLRSVGQKAAALGRVGAGLTTSELGDVETIHNRDLDLSRRQLAAEGAGHTLDDRIRQLGAAKDVYGAVTSANNSASLGAEELNQRDFSNRLTLARDLYGRESDDFGRRTGERDSGFNREQTLFGNERNKLQDSSIYEQDIYGRDRDARDEYRGERGWQYGLERDALGDRERQYGMEQDAESRDFNRSMELAKFGYGTNPAGAVNGAGQQANQNAQSYLDQLGPMFLEWAKRNRQAPGVSGGSSYDPSAV